MNAPANHNQNSPPPPDHRAPGSNVSCDSAPSASTLSASNFGDSTPSALNTNGISTGTSPIPLRPGQQNQFLEVVDRDTATQRFQSQLRLQPIGIETLPITSALQRTLAEDVVVPVDVPGFDRSNVDGYAVLAADTFGASESAPRRLSLLPHVITPGQDAADIFLTAGTCCSIATGSMLPNAATAILMVEYSELLETPAGPVILVTRPVSSGENVSYAGSDLARGEVALRGRTLLTSREIGVLAALGYSVVPVFRKPTVAIISTGNEIVPPGEPLPPGSIYDSNAAILATAVQEQGGEPILLGVVRDNETAMRARFQQALEHDVVILTGGTSKGVGDVSYKIASELRDPGIVAHGVALKPGKPVCLAVTAGKPVAVLPGFPTSAIFTFHEFVAPVIRQLAGRSEPVAETVTASLPMRVNSERGRTEYLLVSLIHDNDGLVAFPLGKGSGSVTSFSFADGYITIPQHTEQLEAHCSVTVRLLSAVLEPADLVVIGSHCVGLDIVLGEMHRLGFRTKTLAVGSLGGLSAAQRNRCDVAGIHLLDPETGVYNTSFVTTGLHLEPGYLRKQGLVFRPGDIRFEGRASSEIAAAIANNSNCRMINRNTGSGTRILIDQLLDGVQPPGYELQSRSHNAVCAAIAQNRADWGVAIETVARLYNLAFTPLQDEEYSFVIPVARLQRPAVQAFCKLLQDVRMRQKLSESGFQSFTTDCKHRHTAGNN